MRPVSAGRLLEAEEGTGLPVDPSFAAQVVSRVLHILLDDTTWEWSQRALSPENPEPSPARVGISNSTEVESLASVSPASGPNMLWSPVT